MNISFVEAEAGEREFFAAELAGHELEFPGTLEEVRADAEALSVFIYSHVDGTFLDAHQAVRLVSTRSTTTDHIDLAECARRGVAVRCVPTYGDHTVAEHTLALLLALSRRLREVWSGPRRRAISYEQLRGFELRGKTFGILGLGRIGQQVVPIARAVGMPVIVHDPQVKPALAQALSVRVVSFEELLRESHIISLHASLTEETRHILNRDTLARCRRGVIILNTARGALIETAALDEALASGQVGGAGLDVLEDERVMHQQATQIVGEEIVRRLRAARERDEPRDPARIQHLSALMRSEGLLARPNVVFTPHIAFNSIEAIERVNRATVEHLRAFAQHARAPSPFPAAAAQPALAAGR